jgi:hypothetical protein
MWLEPFFSVPIGEANTLLAMIHWVRELGFDYVIFSTDSKIVADAYNSTLQDVLSSVLLLGRFVA